MRNRIALNQLLPRVFAIAALAAAAATMLFILNAKASVSNVVLTDTDNSGYGLDGRDFTITWTPSSTPPAGYTNTMIFITTSGVRLSTTTLLSTGCGGSPCQARGGFNQYNMATATLMQYMPGDSFGNNWATTSPYIAWVYTTANEVTLVSSSPASVTFDVVADTAAPSIDHSPVHAATENAGAVINAFIHDDQTSDQGFANPSGNIYFRAYYATGTFSGGSFATGMSLAGSEVFQFTVPTATVVAAGGSFKYYLAASDAAGNARFFCANPNATGASDCQASPFVVNTVTAGSRSVSGVIYFNTATSTSPLASVKVFAGGFGRSSVTTDINGNYTITGLPNNDGFDITATKVQYCKNTRFETIGSVDKTGVNLNLNPGSCFFDMSSGGSGGGGGGAPMVMFSGPQDGMDGVPLGEKLRVGLNQTMDSATINDADATNAGSNVYLTTDDGTTKVAGTVTFCANNGSPGCSSLFAQDTNTILFSPTSSLSSSTFYTLVITEGVKSQGGQSIQGNRQGGGHKISFVSSGGSLDMGQFGQSGQFMPPYVKSMIPAPGISAAPNAGITVEFNEAMNSASMTGTNIKLFNITGGANTEVSSGVSVSLDSTEKRFVTISHSVLSAGTYEVRVLGAAASASGISMRPPGNASDAAFRSSFPVSGSSDNTSPTIYPLLTNNSTGVAVNTIFQFGFNESLSLSTVNTTNITLYRGATAAAVSLKYDAGSNNVFVVPNSVLAPNTVYTLTLGGGVTDAAGNALATSTYTYTTGSGDSAAPAFKEARCDDYTCKVFFTEPMNHDAQVDSNWVSSTLNHARLTLTQGGGDKIVTSTRLSYDALNNAVSAEGVNLTAGGANFSLTLSGLTDISGNVLPNTTVGGPVEDSKKTFGSFGDMGMFGPPTGDFTGGSIGGGEFKPQGFGSFTADQFAFGQADMAFAFNPTAGADANVFQARFNPGVVVSNGDKIVLTFPAGTVASSAAADSYSPYASDYNGDGGGTITGSVTADSATQVTIALTVAGGTPGTSDSYTIDLKKIINPTIPKGPNTGGYTLGMKLTNSAGTTVKASKTSMPYFIMAGGTNTLTVSVVAGNSTSSAASGANGTVFVHGGGPGGPMDKSVTLTNGAISAVEGTSTTSIIYGSLPDGCYFLGTDPFVTLNGSDYFGQMTPEPMCLTGGQARTQYLHLAPASAGTGSATVTVKFSGISDFGGRDIDIFAGGPGKFVVKTLSGVNAPNAGGYAVKLPANGNWFLGVGPAMPKGASTAKPAALPGVPPAPIDLTVSGLPGAASVSAGIKTVPGVAFNDSTDTVTFTFATADKTVTGTVKDGSGSGLGSVEVFMHRQGFGAPVFGTTNASGSFSLSLSDYGVYEIGVFKDGLPPVMKNIELKNDGSIYFDGKQISGSNPLVIVVKKASYTISGKVLDSSNNGISGAPVMAIDASGNSVFGSTASDGSYTLYVDNGTWKVKSELPPDKTDTCGALSTTVTVSGSSQSSQNLTPSTATCYTLSGTVSVGGSGLASVPLFIEEWDNTNSRPVNGGARRNSNTDSSGAYSVKLVAGTYRVGAWSPEYGELGAVKTVSADATQNITVASTSSVTFTFTGGTSAMNGYLELKNTDDKTKRIGKSLQGLDSTATVTVPASTNFNYFLDVFGVGKYTGTTTAGGSVTVDLGVSSGQFITVTGTIYSGSTTSTIAGALVTFKNASTSVVQTAITDSSGQYTAKIKSGNYTVASNVSGYVAGQSPQSQSFTTGTTAYDFGGSSPDQAGLSAAPYTIEGTVSSSAGTAMSQGYITAVNSSGTVVSAAINSNGTYSLPVTAGDWTVKALGPNHALTAKSGAVTISSGNSTGNNFSLTADTTKASTSTTGIVAASAGGSVNDSSASGIKFTAGQGVLDTGSGNINLTLEKSYSAPSTTNFTPLGNATFAITASGDSTIKNLNGNAEVQIDFSSLSSLIPSGVSTSTLQLVYYSAERGDYVPVEGGFTVDATNQTITGLTSHLTDFVIAYTPSAGSSGSSPSPSPSPAASGGGGGGDSSAPTNPSVIINSGATTTNNYAVTLSLSANESASLPMTMMIANDTNFTGANWVAYATTSPWSLTAGAGVKTVYAKFKDNAGNATAAAIDTIELLANATGTPAIIPVVTTTVATTTVATTTSETKTIETKATEMVAKSSITNPDSAVKITAPSDLSFQPGEKLVFSYSYKNSAKKAVKVRVQRDLLFGNRLIKRSSAYRTLKAGATFTSKITETIAKTYKPGEYSERIKILDARNKVLAENSLLLTVEKLKKKFVTLGTPTGSASITFDAVYLGKIKAGTAIPTTLRLKYSYENQTASKQTIRLVRELVGPAGTVLESRPGRWNMSPGEKDSLVFTLPLTNNFAAGQYQIRLRAYNAVGDKALIAEHSLPLTIELK